MMKHPLHGRLPVYSPSEVESNKAAGWVIDPDAPESQTLVSLPKPAPVAEHEPEPVAKPMRKGFFGLRDEDEV
jgi:hypothetical protein